MHDGYFRMIKRMIREDVALLSHTMRRQINVAMVFSITAIGISLVALYILVLILRAN